MSLQAQAEIDSGAIPTFVNIVVPDYLNTAGVRGGRGGGGELLTPNQPINKCLFCTLSSSSICVLGADSLSVLSSPFMNAVICHGEHLFYKLLAPAISATTGECLVPS